ncbi:unnamed protein product [Rotaria sp. Silwood2]|nr:unnamed protein product [Rotaria sp. Silwood2]CAF3972345.1 unnamed protein product [Rotaria sp. Silwood2]
MQPINTERQQANDRLQRQLPVNTVKATTKPIYYKRVNQISQSAPNRFDKLTGANQQQWPLRRLHTDLDDFDTHRSLSSCPTYSSLSRTSPETHECATQITTLTPTETIEDNQDISTDSPLPIDTNQVLVIDENPTEELELMPISSGFGYYPYSYPTTRRVQLVQPQIVSRAPQTYRDQFRDKNQNGFNNNSGTKPTGKLPRPTAAKQSSPRSDTYALSTKRNEVNTRVSKDDLVQKNSRRIVPSKERFVRNPSTPPENRRVEPIRRNDVIRPIQKNRNLPNDRQDFPPKPLRFANKQNGANRSSTPPAYYQKSSSLSRDVSQKPRRMRIANNEYVIERRRQPSDYVYDDYRTESPIERRRPQRVVRVLRDTPYRDYEDDDDAYYVEPASTRRPRVVRRPPPREYVYVDDSPTPSRHHRSGRREVIYVDDERPSEYEDEYIYVDENGNEIDFIDERNPSKQYVEYIDDDDDDDRDRRRSRKSKVIYVDDEPPINQRRNKSKSKQPSSTRIVYE